MPLNKFGYPYLYPSAEGERAFFYQQSQDITDDAALSSDGADNIVESGGADGEFTIHTDGPSSIHLVKDPTFHDSIGGCSMNFAQTVARGYGNKASDVRDFELMLLVRILSTSESGDRLALSGTTGHHTSSNCCQGFNYMVMIDYNSDPVEFQFRKEMKHVDYFNDPNRPQDSSNQITVLSENIFTHPSFNFVLKDKSSFTGFAFVRYNKAGGALPGHNTTDSVVLEVWGNPDPEANPLNWIKIATTEDRGGWGSGGNTCGGDSDQIGSFSNGRINRIKSNDPDADIECKDLSVRSIDPTKSFEDTPTQPPENEQPGQTTKIQGSFKFQWDINQDRTSGCAVAGAAIFYSVSPTSGVGISTFFSGTTSIGEYADNSSSIMVGKIIKQADVYLRYNPVGSPLPATPHLFLKIYDSSGVLIYTSPTEIDPSTLTNSFVKYTFDLSTNTYAMQSGSSISLAHANSHATNFIQVGYASGDPIANSRMYAYTGWPPFFWADRDIAMDLFA
jgi:hypothetical protein